MFFHHFVSMFFPLYLAELLAIGIWLLGTSVAFLGDSAIIIIAASSEKLFTHLALNVKAAVVLYALPSAHKPPSPGGSTESFLEDAQNSGTWGLTFWLRSPFGCNFASQTLRML